MSLPEKLKKNRVVILVTGFAAGIAAYQAILEIAHLKVISEVQYCELVNKACETPTIACELVNKACVAPIDERQELLVADSWGYNPAEHEYTITVGFIQLAVLDVLVPASEKGNWSLYVAVRELDQSIDLKTVEYSFLSGPFELAHKQDIMVRTDQEFSETMVQTNGTVQGVIFLMRKSTPVRKPFNAKDYDANDIKWIATSNVLVMGTRQFEPQ